MALFGVLSLVQTVALPGYLLVRSLRVARGILDACILSSAAMEPRPSASVLVAGARRLKIYRPPVLYAVCRGGIGPAFGNGWATAPDGPFRKQASARGGAAYEVSSGQSRAPPRSQERWSMRVAQATLRSIEKPRKLRRKVAFRSRESSISFAERKATMEFSDRARPPSRNPGRRDVGDRRFRAFRHRSRGPDLSAMGCRRVVESLGRRLGGEPLALRKRAFYPQLMPDENFSAELRVHAKQ